MTELINTIAELEKQAADTAKRLAEAGHYERAARQQAYFEAFSIVRQIIKDMEAEI